MLIKLDLYNVKIKIEVLDTYEKLKRKLNFYLKKYKIDEEDDPTKYYDGCVILNPNDTQIIHLLYTEEAMNINTIAHECFHLTNIILDFHGVSSTQDDESHAILNGFLNQEVVNYLLKKKYLKL